MRLKISLMILITAVTAFAGDRARYTEVREENLPADRETIWVDGGKNGGISIKGWDEDQIYVKATIKTWANNDSDAEELAADIRLEFGDRIHAEGPRSKRYNQGWSVSFEVYVPLQSNLKLETHNGGIGISEVNGDITFNALNGGVKLYHLAGNVNGRTTNGGVKVELDGDTWDGAGLDVQTTNGGVVLSMPAGYNARLETGTVNGSIKTDFPVTVKGKIGRKLNATIGNGGATIRVRTTNGGVAVREI
ncbi:MAG: DUF4097 family beta strand repeat-containing protein [Acidobacteriota bacterium]|nr:DUF4097 family beta strand repeat-containing protein [Acidobacteriota bacterium]